MRKVDFKNMPLNELYNLLSDEDKQIVSLYENIYNIDITDLPILKKYECYAFITISETLKSIRLNLVTKAKSSKTDLKKDISPIKNLQNPIVKAIRNNNQPLAWYLVKKELYNPVKPDEIFPSLINNASDFIEIILYMHLKKTKQNELAIYRILKRMIENPEEETILLQVYEKLKKTKYCDINQYSSFNWINYLSSKSANKVHFRKGTVYLHVPQETYMLHESILTYPTIVPYLLKFKDLDVNIKNKSNIEKPSEFSKLENPSPTNGNLPIMQLFRWADLIHIFKQDPSYKRGLISIFDLDIYDLKAISEKYDITKSNEYIDEFIKRGALLDYKNANGESVVMTAIHHYHVHGVEVCKHLLYPEILHDMEKLNGRSLWAELPVKICEILSAKFPSMTDSLNITYSEYLSNKTEYDSHLPKDKILHQDFLIDLIDKIPKLNPLLDRASYLSYYYERKFGEESSEYIGFNNKKQAILEKYGIDDHYYFAAGEIINAARNEYQIQSQGITEYKKFIENEEEKMFKDPYYKNTIKEAEEKHRFEDIPF